MLNILGERAFLQAAQQLCGYTVKINPYFILRLAVCVNIKIESQHPVQTIQGHGSKHFVLQTPTCTTPDSKHMLLNGCSVDDVAEKMY